MGKLPIKMSMKRLITHINKRLSIGGALYSGTTCSGVPYNGLLPRRRFLQRGALQAGISAAMLSPVSALANAREPWMNQPGQPFSNYGQPSAHEKSVRWISNTAASPANGLSWTPIHSLEGTITPSGLHFERHHNGIPVIDPDRHKLLIHGEVERALTFSIDNLHRYPLESRICFIECGGNSNACWREDPIQTPAGYFHGMVSNSEWTGVPLSLLLAEAGVKRASGLWAIAEGADAFAMNVSLPIDKLYDDAILALYQNGEAVRPENGYPLRLIVPGWEGVLNVKWLRRLHIATQPAMSRNETSKYTELLGDGTSRQFTFVMQAKSVITTPSSTMRLRQKGIYPVSGIAWSGAGRVTKVEISADGGNTWAIAELQAPVLRKALTRFRLPFDWRGQPAVLQSRVTDETGYTQPTRETLVKQRGRQGYFHYNAITSWQIDTEGFVTHVYA